MGLGYVVSYINEQPAINNDYIDFVMPSLSGVENKILMFIGDAYAKNGYQPVLATHKNIKKGTGVKSKVSIRNALRDLTGAGFLIKTGANIYRPNPEVEINTDGSNSVKGKGKKNKFDALLFIKNAKKNVSPKIRIKVFERDNFRCVYCGRSAKDGIRLEADHIHPKSKGGSNEISNLQTLCNECNIGKSNRIIKR